MLVFDLRNDPVNPWFQVSHPARLLEHSSFATSWGSFASNACACLLTGIKFSSMGTVIHERAYRLLADPEPPTLHQD
jgi:hypothetical protein